MTIAATIQPFLINRKMNLTASLTQKLFDLFIGNQREAIAIFMKDCSYSYDPASNTLKIQAFPYGGNPETLYNILWGQLDYFKVPDSLQSVWIELHSPTRMVTITTPLDCQRNS